MSQPSTPVVEMSATPKISTERRLLIQTGLKQLRASLMQSEGKVGNFSGMTQQYKEMKQYLQQIFPNRYKQSLHPIDPVLPMRPSTRLKTPGMMLSNIMF